jgi:hypothetical protein
MVVTDPNITLKLFYARVADYHHLLGGGDHTTKVTVNQLEDAAAEAMLHAVDLFRWLAKGGHPPDWTQQR